MEAGQSELRMDRKGPGARMNRSQIPVSIEPQAPEAVGLIAEAFFREPRPQLKQMIEELERSLILSVLVRVRGNQREAARILGIKHTTLNQKVKRYGIRFERFTIIGTSAFSDLTD